jgi:hypothetical protein
LGTGPGGYTAHAASGREPPRSGPVAAGRWTQTPPAQGLDQAEISAAQVKGRLAEQSQTAFAHRTRVERAKGMLMMQEGIDDAAAFERLRSVARSSRRPAALLPVTMRLPGCLVGGRQHQRSSPYLIRTSSAASPVLA